MNKLHYMLAWNGKLPDVMTGSDGTMLNVTTK